MDLADRPTSIASDGQSLDAQRAARLAAMSASATDLYEQRNKSLAQRAEDERGEDEKDERLRKKYGKEDVSGGFFREGMGGSLADSLARRAGKGLLKE